VTSAPRRITRLLDLKQLDVEDQCAVRRDPGHGTASVGKVCRDGQPALSANRHAHNADIPTLNNLALADLEGERRALLVGCVVLGQLISAFSEMKKKKKICYCHLQSNTLPF
jgi:hypothetical protein